MTYLFHCSLLSVSFRDPTESNRSIFFSWVLPPRLDVTSSARKISPFVGNHRALLGDNIISGYTGMMLTVDC